PSDSWKVTEMAWHARPPKPRGCRPSKHTPLAPGWWWSSAPICGESPWRATHAPEIQPRGRSTRALHDAKGDWPRSVSGLIVLAVPGTRTEKLPTRTPTFSYLNA